MYYLLKKSSSLNVLFTKVLRPWTPPSKLLTFSHSESASASGLEAGGCGLFISCLSMYSFIKAMGWGAFKCTLKTVPGWCFTEDF